jgi:hypothetical protein
MKTTVLFFGLLFGANISAQIFITSAHFIDVSDVVQLGIDANPSISHTPAGPNQTWDYGELNNSSIDFIALGMAEWYSAASNFPTATLGTEDADGTQIFFRKTSEAFDLIGAYGDLAETGTNTPVGFAPYQRQLSFPSTYGTSFENVSTINLFIDNIEEADSVIVTITTHRFSEMDAWGTITTPFGTFPTIRQHIKDSTIQEATAYLFGLPVFNQSETVITHSFSFYTDAQNARYTLLQYNYDPEANLLENVQWQMAAPILNINNEVETQVATIYPNPAVDEVHVQFDEPFNGELIVYDISGKTIAQKQYSNLLQDAIDVNNWTPGVYFFQFISEKNTMLKKVIVK